MQKIKILLPLVLFCLFFGAGRANAQWTVIDPSNIAQSIVNSSKSLVQESTTATNMVRNFQETVKIYQQAKKYYDALQSVNNLVRDARKVQQTVLMLGDISGYYVNNFKKMKRLKNLTAYYTNKNISVSYLRAKKKADTQRVVSLYGDGSEKYW